MFARPEYKPVTEPVEGFTVAAPELDVLQVPPDVASVSVIDEPLHTEPGPEIAETPGVTVIAWLAVQPPNV
jgi:hypothetical protein